MLLEYKCWVQEKDMAFQLLDGGKGIRGLAGDRMQRLVRAA